jgi:NADH:ubiquinone reductase (H+-translocating)
LNQRATPHASHDSATRIRVVILGGGFAGLNAARALGGRKPFDVTLIDRVNHYTFQPLLYQVASASLSATDIADPLRVLLSRFSNVQVLLGEALRVDVTARCVFTTAGTLPYDYLLVACGVQTSYFGNERWEQFAPGLKSLAQATEIHARILSEFEIAERETNRDAVRRHLTFVVVGGGATGVELAGAIAEISRRTLVEDFRAISTAASRIILIEAAARLLSPFSERLSEHARRDLEALGVEVRLNTRVQDIRDGAVILDGEHIDASVILWAAGVRGVPIAETLGAQLDRQRCVHVGPDCSIAGHPEVFVAGDLAVCAHHKTGKPLSQVANVAAQQGRHFARNLRRELRRKPRQPFHYFNKGQMATIGVGRAICEIGPIGFGGLFAWITWIGIHIYYLSSMRNRFFVFIIWTWSLITRSRHARVVIPTGWHTYPVNTSAEEPAARSPKVP